MYPNDVFDHVAFVLTPIVTILADESGWLLALYFLVAVEVASVLILLSTHEARVAYPVGDLELLLYRAVNRHVNEIYF